MAMAIAHCSRVSLYGFGNASDAKLANGTGGHAAQCGHYCVCAACSERALRTGRCPLCRALCAMAQRVYG